MTDYFYKTHSSSFFHGKRGILLSNIPNNPNFKKDDIVYIHDKALYKSDYGYKQGIEIESNSENFAIISYNKIDLLKNNEDFISLNELHSRESQLFRNFQDDINVKNFKEFSNLIIKYYNRYKNLQQLITITDHTTIEELNLPSRIKTFLYKYNFSNNTTLKELSKFNIYNSKISGLSAKSIQILINYLNIAGLSFKNNSKKIYHEK